MSENRIVSKEKRYQRPAEHALVSQDAAVVVLPTGGQLIDTIMVDHVGEIVFLYPPVEHHRNNLFRLLLPITGNYCHLDLISIWIAGTYHQTPESGLTNPSTLPPQKLTHQQIFSMISFAVADEGFAYFAAIPSIPIIALLPGDDMVSHIDYPLEYRK